MLEISLGQTLKLLREVAGFEKVGVANELQQFINCPSNKLITIPLEIGKKVYPAKPVNKLAYIKAQIQLIELNLKLPSRELLHVLAELYEIDLYDYLELLGQYEHALTLRPGDWIWHEDEHDKLFIGLRKKFGGGRYVTRYYSDKKRHSKDILIRRKENKLRNKQAFKEWQFVKIKPGQYKKALAWAIGYNHEDLSSYINTHLGYVPNMASDDELNKLYREQSAFFLQLRAPYLLGALNEDSDHQWLFNLFCRDPRNKEEYEFYFNNCFKQARNKDYLLSILRSITNAIPMETNQSIAQDIFKWLLAHIDEQHILTEFKSCLPKSMQKHEFGQDFSECQYGRYGEEIDERLRLLEEIRQRKAETLYQIQEKPKYSEISKQIASTSSYNSDWYAEDEPEESEPGEQDDSLISYILDGTRDVVAEYQQYEEFDFTGPSESEDTPIEETDVVDDLEKDEDSQLNQEEPMLFNFKNAAKKKTTKHKKKKAKPKPSFKRDVKKGTSKQQLRDNTLIKWQVPKNTPEHIVQQLEQMIRINRINLPSHVPINVNVSLTFH